MTTAALLILFHQLLFQGMFLAKNLMLGRKLGLAIRGNNPEATSAIRFFVIFIALAGYLAYSGSDWGRLILLSANSALVAALLLLAANLLIGLLSLIDLGDSWRVGVLEEQQTKLVETGIYRFTRNPYFLSYLLMFAAYTVLLQNVILLLLSVAGAGMIHRMILREERYLASQHGPAYQQYRQRVPRYLLV
jgi:protein-S-isoprenylcysteine O-methyltransferase Ste14